MAEQEYGRIDIIKSGESAEVYTAIYPEGLSQYLYAQLESDIPTVVSTPGMHRKTIYWLREDAPNKDDFDQFAKDITYLVTHPNVRGNQQLANIGKVDIVYRTDISIVTAPYILGINSYKFLFIMNYSNGFYGDNECIINEINVECINAVG